MKSYEKIYPTKSKVTKITRAKIKKQTPICIWLTGRSGSGKTTIAQKLEQKLIDLGKHTYVLDGDNLRSGINKDLRFSQMDRVENIRRTAEIAKLFVDSGLIVIVAIISPFFKDRENAKKIFTKKEFFEIFINTPLSICIKRDPKNLYKNSKKNKKINKIGLTGLYQEPKNPFLKISTEKNDPDVQVRNILKKIYKI